MQSIYPRISRPLQEKNTCIWSIAPEFLENEALGAMGLLQSLVASPQIKYCRINLARVQWADPLALLYLALVLAESPLKQSATTLDFGKSYPPDEAHGIFLKFLAQQGFLTAFSEFATIIFDGNIQNQNGDVSLFRSRMASQAQATHFQNADCIFARIIRVDDLSAQGLQQRVELFLEEARTRAVTNPFYSDSLSRDMLFQKLRKLLHGNYSATPQPS